MTYEEAKKLIPKGKYRHYKGGLYTVFAICENTETGKAMVCYYDSTHDWVRPASMWLDELQCTCKRFELIERSRI